MPFHLTYMIKIKKMDRNIRLHTNAKPSMTKTVSAKI